MTNLQLEYAKLLENARHSREQERQGTVDLDIKWFNAKESQRHSLASEALSAADLQEKIRHQTTQDAELLLNNAKTREEIKRHNLATEAQAKADNDVKLAIANLNRQNVLDQISSQQDIAKWKNSTDKEIASLSRALQRYQIDTNKLLKEDELNISRDRVANEAQRIANDFEIAKKNAENNYMQARAAQRQADIASRKAATEQERVDNQKRADTLNAVLKQEEIIMEFLGKAKDAGGVLSFIQAL